MAGTPENCYNNGAGSFERRDWGRGGGEGGRVRWSEVREREGGGTISIPNFHCKTSGGKERSRQLCREESAITSLLLYSCVHNNSCSCVYTFIRALFVYEPCSFFVQLFRFCFIIHIQQFAYTRILFFYCTLLALIYSKNITKGSKKRPPTQCNENVRDSSTLYQGLILAKVSFYFVKGPPVLNRIVGVYTIIF